MPIYMWNQTENVGHYEKDSAQYKLNEANMWNNILLYCNLMFPQDIMFESSDATEIYILYYKTK